jgi:type I site-specific restriction endonuclease
MIHDSRGINIEVFRSLGIQLSNEILNVRGLLRNIEESISRVRSNAERFQISQTELSKRVAFTEEIARGLLDIEEKMKGQSINQKVAFYPEKPQAQPAADRILDQDQLLAERSEQIQEIEVAIQSELLIAREIRDELDDQAQMLIALDRDVDTAATAMRQVAQRIKAIINHEGAVPTAVVAVLAIVLIVLLYIAV